MRAMMPALRLHATVAAMALTLAATPVSAQELPRRLKVDLAAGFGRVSGGGIRRQIPQTFNFGITAATPLRRQSGSRFVGGAGLHVHWPMDFGTDCNLIEGSRGCLPIFPKFTSISLLGGLELGPRRGPYATRILVGPAYVRSDEKSQSLGIQGQLDMTAAQLKRIGVRFWTQGTIAPLGGSGQFVLVSGGLALQL